MMDERRAVLKRVPGSVPDPRTTTDFLSHGRSKPTAHALLREAAAQQRLLVQPRSGVGDQKAMVELLQRIEAEGQPDIQSVTIDSFTRLENFQTAFRTLNTAPDTLNGYPLVSHGYRKGRALDRAVAAPIQVRHGSPRSEVLFEVSLASGFTAFEGGGLSYNLPYAKNVPLADSLESWAYVDRVCGQLATSGIIIDREFFGTLSAVLVPPAIALSVTLIEAMLAARAGVRSLSIAYAQGGHPVQDVAAVQAIRTLGRELLPDNVDLFPVLHQYMGPFPQDPGLAESLIAFGTIVARLGGATKVVTKTRDEAFRIPTATANAQGLSTARTAARYADALAIDYAAVEAERLWIEREVHEIIDPVVNRSDVSAATVAAFDQGALDVPFSTSRHARDLVVCMRDCEGAIRFKDPGKLPLSPQTLGYNRQKLPQVADGLPLVHRMQEDINYFNGGRGMARLTRRESDESDAALFARLWSRAGTGGVSQA